MVCCRTASASSDMVDYFKFSLSAAKTVGVGLRSLRSDADLFVEDSVGTVLAWSRNESNANELLNAALSAGSYFVRVQAQERRSTAYTLTMGTAGVDSADAGFGTAAAVAVGGQYRGEISPSWDIDWVRVDLAADGVYALEVRALGAAAGSLVDPELTAVYVDPADDSVFSSYGAADRVTSYGRVCGIGLTVR